MPTIPSWCDAKRGSDPLFVDQEERQQSVAAQQPSSVDWMLLVHFVIAMVIYQVAGFVALLSVGLAFIVPPLLAGGYLYWMMQRRGANVPYTWTVGTELIGLGFGVVDFVVGLGVGHFTSVDSSAAGDLGSTTTGFNLVLLVIAMVILAPVVEEYTFRGVLWRALGGIPTWLIIGITALAFSLFHLEPARILMLFVSGVILGLVRWRWSLAASTTAHMLNNTIVAIAMVSTALA